MKLKTLIRKTKREIDHQRRFGTATGYVATGSDLGELLLLEASLQHNLTEMRSCIERTERIGKRLVEIRERIKSRETT
jgi:hypothetical protein